MTSLDSEIEECAFLRSKLNDFLCSDKGMYIEDLNELDYKKVELQNYLEEQVRIAIYNVTIFNRINKPICPKKVEELAEATRASEDYKSTILVTDKYEMIRALGEFFEEFKILDSLEEKIRHLEISIDFKKKIL